MHWATAERDNFGDRNLEVIERLWRGGLGFGRKACESAPCREGPRSYDDRTNIVLVANEKADALAKGADADGRHMAAARALTIKHLRKELCID